MKEFKLVSQSVMIYGVVSKNNDFMLQKLEKMPGISVKEKLKT